MSRPGANRGAGHAGLNAGRRVCGDSGGAAVELVLITPLLLAMFFFIVQLGRLVDAEGSLEGAARDAARAASIARSDADAQADAQAAAEASIDEEEIPCTTDPDVTVTRVDSPQWGPAVQVTVACYVDFSGAPIAGTPNSVQRSASFVAPIDELSFRS